MKQVLRLTENDLHNLISESVMRILNEGVADEWNGLCHDPNDTHFAVNKQTNLIVNSWDYSGHDNSELKQYAKDYFFNDLEDNGFNPKEYKILTKKGCMKYGINPDECASWSNDGNTPLHDENQ